MKIIHFYYMYVCIYKVSKLNVCEIQVINFTLVLVVLYITPLKLLNYSMSN